MAKTPAKKKAPALDIFKTLSAIDKRDYNFYANLSDEEKKGFAPIVVSRWLSAVEGNEDVNAFYLMMVNENVNKNFWDSTISKHPELQYKMMAACGIGKSVKHKWIKGYGRKSAKSKFMELLSSFYPSASVKELEYLISINSIEQLTQLVNDAGLQDEDIKKMVKEIKELKAND